MIFYDVTYIRSLTEPLIYAGILTAIGDVFVLLLSVSNYIVTAFFWINDRTIIFLISMILSSLSSETKLSPL